MLTVRDLLLAARTAQALPSNYALARMLDVRENDVSRWWNGRAVPVAAMVVRLADLAGLDPAQVLPAIEAQRPGDARVRDVWQRAAQLAERAAAVAACAVLALCITQGGGDGGSLVEAGAGVLGIGQFTVYTLCCVVLLPLLLMIDPAGRGVNRVRVGSIRLA